MCARVCILDVIGSVFNINRGLSREICGIIRARLYFILLTGAE